MPHVHLFLWPNLFLVGFSSSEVSQGKGRQTEWPVMMQTSFTDDKYGNRY